MIANRTSATANSDLNWIESWGVSPLVIWAMNAAIVPPCSSGLTVSFGLKPIARTTAIVSPTARDIARMIDAMIPDSAAGKTTRRTTSKRVAPIANAPSRRPRGTARSASSDSDAISGVISRPTTMPGRQHVERADRREERLQELAA